MAIVGRGCMMEPEESLTDQMRNDSEFQSKRKQLVVVSILLMAMSLSDAQLKEANTFIFKIDFSNSAAFGWMVFFGVIVLMIRYYSFAFKYHFYLFEMWAEDMMCDYRVFGYHTQEDDPGEYYPHGLFSKLKNHSCSRSISHYDFERDRIKPTYKAHGFFKRTLHYDVHNSYEPETHAVNLNKFDENWTMKDYLKMIGIEIKYQSNALFRQPEYLDISLPYLIASLSLISFIFKHQILYLLL